MSIEVTLDHDGTKATYVDAEFMESVSWAALIKGRNAICLVKIHGEHGAKAEMNLTDFYGPKGATVQYICRWFDGRWLEVSRDSNVPDAHQVCINPFMIRIKVLSPNGELPAYTVVEEET